MPQGRPTDYTEAIAGEICERLSKGETLTSICKDEHMPAVRTVSHWKERHESFLADFARAREDGFDAIADECLTIADDNTRDVQEYEITEGVKGTSVDYEVIQRSKLRVETRLKLLAKWSKRYSDRIDLTSGGEKLAPTTTTVTIVQPLPDDE
jgi:hypothetical protein